MKKLFAAVVVLSLATVVKAQEIPERKTDRHPGHAREHGGKRGDRSRHEMMKQLNLTEGQKQEMKANKENFRKQFEELKKQDNITVKEWKSKMETLRKEQRTKMENVLTPEQKTKMEQLKKDMQARRGEMMKQRMEKMKTDLNLSQEQVTKMEKQRTEMEQKMKAIRENKALSDEQRKEQTKELMKQRKENMKSILTEEQMKKMKESKGHFRHGARERKPEKKEVI